MTPTKLVLDAGAVARLNWQPRVCPAPLPCIAARRGHILELIFTPPGGIGNHANADHDPASWSLKGIPRHRYRLDHYTEKTVLATLIDDDEEAIS